VTANPDVDIVIALHRPGAWIDGCLASVRAQRDVVTRTILVDDDPSEALAASLAAVVPNAVAIGTTRNRGFAAANNAGIAAGAAPYVLCLNQDARLAPDYLSRLVALLSSSPRLGSASGKVLRIHSPSGRADGVIDSAGLEMRAGRRAVDLGQGSPDDGRFDGQHEVFGVSAATGLYRRTALDAVSTAGEVFDESFFMYKEDVDLAWRLRRAGFGACVDGGAVAYHGRSAAGPPPGGGLPGLLALLANERAKPTRIRRLSWRNQLLMVAKNESRDSIGSALMPLVHAQLQHAVADLLLDPAGGLVNRLLLTRQIPRAIARRSGRYSVDLSRWLP
jgi:GT2 family glycosyltransferase